MIYFGVHRQDAEFVTVKIHSGLEVGDPYLQFGHGCKTDIEALLLARHLNRMIDAAVENARKQAYEQGYQDGRSRRRKKKNMAVKLDAHCPGVW